MPVPQFVQQLGMLIQQHGLMDTIVVVRDPATGQVGFYGPNGALERLKPAILKKLENDIRAVGPDPTDTEWG